MNSAKDVEGYISKARKENRPQLREVRSAIKRAAPDADESISYGCPFYSYRGEVGIARRLCYFRQVRGGVGFYMRPRDLDPNREKVARFRGGKSALLFRRDEPIPVALIEALVREAVNRFRSGKTPSHLGARR